MWPWIHCGEAVAVSLGCGNPAALVDLQPGQTVLDLGSGGGIDVLDPGGRLVVSFTTANHDGGHFEDPERFAIDRPDAADHVTFGWGPHFCLGAGLARVELQESLRALAARFDAPQLAADRPSGGGWADSLLVRWPARSR